MRSLPPMDEARMERNEYGLVAETEGWFTVNVRDAAWVTNEQLGDACIIEGGAYQFPQIGYTLAVLQPGEPSAMYHWEKDQEDFLVLQGECLAIIEGKEIPLKAWDFVHCPGGTAHIFVGAGDGPCVVFMIGARQYPKSGTYIADPVALKHNAAPEHDTTESKEAYARFPKFLPGRPPSFEGLALGLNTSET